MKIDKKSGKVLHTDIFESLIQSQHRGEYGKIFENFQKKSFENTLLENTIFSAFELFEIIKKRRKKEGKISFETTELYFDFEKNSHTPIGIRKRDRNDAHRLIEEFMVLANEEVAKWCTKRKIPFLSRVQKIWKNSSKTYRWISRKTRWKCTISRISFDPSKNVKSHLFTQ